MEQLQVCVEISDEVVGGKRDQVWVEMLDFGSHGRDNSFGMLEIDVDPDLSEAVKPRSELHDKQCRGRGVCANLQWVGKG